MRSRRGVLLAELLCAMAIAGLLATACALALGGVRRATTAAEARARALRSGREALAVVTALARDADSLVVLGDTAIDLQVRIASGVVCGRDAVSLTLPPARVSSGAALLARSQPVEAGDHLAVLAHDTTTGVRWWVRAVVDSAMERSGEVPCGSADGLVDVLDAAAPRLRLVPSLGGTAVLGGTVGAGAPVRLARRGRLALYAAGGGEWMLGWRRCQGGVCGVVQPLAGPLRSAAAGGFRARLAGDVLLVSVRMPGLPATLDAAVRRIDAGR